MNAVQPPPLPHRAVTQPERTLLACSAAAAVLGAAVAWGLAHGLASWGCAWKACTGWPCAACGGTRAVLLLAGGRWADAFALNPGVVLGLGLLVLANLYAAAVLLFRLRPWRPRPWLQARWRWLLPAALLANWLYLLVAGAA